jgi:FlaG/FlaF family flagellin (archaellin)
MALVDPITVAASAPTPALTFSVVRRDGYGSDRWDVANGFQLSFSHSTTPNAGERHYMKVSQTLDATSPYTGQVSKQTASVSISASFPAFGWTAATKAALVKALTDTLADGDVTAPKFVAFES